MKKYTVIGMARSGIAAAYKLKELGYKPYLSEYKVAEDILDAEKLRQDFDCEFGGHTDKVLDSDLIIVSPGIPDIPILRKAKEQNIEIISEIEFGYRIKHPNSKIIAITGSNGKSTTVSLIHHLLITAGYNSVLAGNIGTAFTSYPIEKPEIDFIVLELSSFQLELIDRFKPDVAAILNITPDHLNRYAGFDDYAKTKFNIFQNLSENELAIINADDEATKKFIPLINGNLKQFSTNNEADIFVQNNEIVFANHKFNIDEIKIKGPHNIANALAALLAVSPFNIPNEDLRKGLATFVSLPHRLEYVDTIAGVKFINDSKATNTDSVKYALQSFDRPIRIIMGGKGKGEDYRILNKYLSKFAKKIYLIGETIAEMRAAFSGVCEFEEFDSFKAAIVKAFEDAKSGEDVVLSPACTSYDMFANFEVRGDTFKEIVRELKK